MKIKNVKVNNYKKSIEIETARGSFSLPFSRLELEPSSKDKISEIYIDPELGNETVTYTLESGDESSVHIDVFLDFNKDPDYLKTLFLFELTIKAQASLKSSGLSKNEVCRQLKTSPSQLARLLDQTNQKKTVDKMLQLLAVLGVSVRPLFDNADVA